ncbi:MAG: methyltransferase domain-containing protein [Butyrivibrio sp.]|nr:methyltransferase domain-containing protein [Muribaculum sp.]MCM1551480.1 methyltransferase domain-containing protein [Butyrivibrio sp.]
MNKAKSAFIRLRRYVLFLAEYIFYEKPRGLDFTMRDKSLSKKSGFRYHGYSKTNEKHLREIFQRLSFEDARILDVGCGKGVVLKEAVKFPFQKIAGIEIQEKLAQTAKRNFEILGISDKIECLQCDALDFDRYGDYNVFFFFNPFSEEVLQKVVDKIIKSRGGEDDIITVIYHNPRFLSVFDERTKILKKEMLHDTLKEYDTCILAVCPKDMEDNY